MTVTKKCRKCKKQLPLSEFAPMNIWKYGVASTCISCVNFWGSNKPKKPIKQISDKKRQRIKDNWSEYKVFVEIWKERPHICDNCWWYIKYFDPSCFAHKLSKKNYPELRYDKENIALVHWVFEVKNEQTGETYTCHKEYDLKYNKQKKWITTQ